MDDDRRRTGRRMLLIGGVLWLIGVLVIGGLWWSRWNEGRNERECVLWNRKMVAAYMDGSTPDERAAVFVRAKTERPDGCDAVVEP